MKTKKTKLTFYVSTRLPFYLHLVILLFAVSFLFISCGANDPPPPPPVEDEIKNTIDVTEEWRDLESLEIKFTKSSIDTLGLLSYNLLMNGTEAEIFLNLKSDTTYTHTGLTEGTEYRYKVEAYEETKLKDTSKTLLLSTLSPTSHNIEWKVDTLGMPGDFLNDVWGLDENNVWAVGGVNLPEGSSGIIKWNGTNWEPLPSFAGTKTGIFGFSENNIWVVTGGTFGKIANWNGSSWQEYSFFPPPPDTVWALNSVWGNSAEDIWAVGDRGTIVHWDGVEWSKVNNSIINPTYTIRDIWGFDENNIFVGANKQGEDVIIYKYDGTTWEIFLKRFTPVVSFATLWGYNKNNIYFFDYRKFKIENGTELEITLPGQSSTISKIRGSGGNNIFTCGAFGEVFHYNGIEWKRNDQLDTYPSSRLLQGIWTNEKEVFIVGLSAGTGAIFINGKIRGN